MNSIMKFNNINVGIIEENGEPLFEVYSTGMALGQIKYSKGKVYPRKDRIDENLKSAEISAVVRDGQLYITEPQLYDLMIEMKTDKVKPFRKWVTHDVLPTIRKTGSYSVQSKSDSYMIENPAERARRWAEEYEEKLALEQKIEKDKPLVEFAEHIQVSEDCISMNDMAKLASKNGVKIGRNRLFAFLRNQKVLKKDNIPYQRYIEAQHWFQVKESVYDTANFTRICLTTMVTPQGQRGIIKMIKKERLLV